MNDDSEPVPSEQALFWSTQADGLKLKVSCACISVLQEPPELENGYLYMCSSACLWGHLPATGLCCAFSVEQHLWAPHIGLGSPTLSPYCLVGSERALTNDGCFDALSPVVDTQSCNILSDNDSLDSVICNHICCSSNDPDSLPRVPCVQQIRFWLLCPCDCKTRAYSVAGDHRRGSLQRQ